MTSSPVKDPDSSLSALSTLDLRRIVRDRLELSARSPQAIAAITEIISRGESNPYDYVRRGIAYHAGRRLLPAIEDYTHVIELAPIPDRPRSVSADAPRSTTKKKRAAGMDPERILQLQLDCMARRLRAYIQAGSSEPILEDADFILRHRPGDLYTLITRGLTRMHNRQLAESMTDWDAIIAAVEPRRPKSASQLGQSQSAHPVELSHLLMAYCGKGGVLLSMGRYEDAVAQFTEAVSLGSWLTRHRLLLERHMENREVPFESFVGLYLKSIVRRSVAYVLSDDIPNATRDNTRILVDEGEHFSCLEPDAAREHFLSRAVCDCVGGNFDKAVFEILHVTGTAEIVRRSHSSSQQQQQQQYRPEAWCEALLYPKLLGYKKELSKILSDPQTPSDLLETAHEQYDEGEFTSAALTYGGLLELVGVEEVDVQSEENATVRRDALFGKGLSLFRTALSDSHHSLYQRCISCFSRCLETLQIVPDESLRKDVCAFRAFCYCQHSQFNKAVRDLENSSMPMQKLTSELRNPITAETVASVGTLLRAYYPQLHAAYQSLDRDRTCRACGAGDKRLFQCSRCKGVKYCSRDCQRRHWPAHRKVCGIS